MTIGVVLTTIVWSMGVTAFVPVASAVTLSAGDLIKGSLSTVYFYAADGKRYTYPTESTFKTWRYDFSQVKKISDSELAAIDLAGNIVVRPGTKLVKIQSVPKVFAVIAKGKLRHIANEAAAQALYGANWAKRIIDIPDGFWVNYVDTGIPLDGTSYPEGQLVKKSDSSDVYYVNADGTWSKITSEAAFLANRFNWADVVTAPASMTFTAGADITGAVAALIDDSQGGGTNVPTQPQGGALTVSLASDNPAGMTVPTAVPVTVMKFNLAAGSKAVEVTSITLKAGGLGDSTNIKDVTLYVGNSKIGTSKNVNSDKIVTFNFSTPLVIDAGTTKGIEVKATFAAEGYYMLGIDAATRILSNASAINGSFPINSNQMYAFGAVAVGTLTFDADDNDTTARIGEDNVTLVEFTAAANNVEDIKLSGLILKNNGTVSGSQLGMLNLYHAGTKIATAKMDSSKYVNFSFDPITIKKGETEDFKVTGDIESGSNGDTILLYIKDATDVKAIGAGYGYQVSIVKTAFDTDDVDSTEITLTAGKFTMNFDKIAVPAADIRRDADNINMGQVAFTATNEAVKITSLLFNLNGVTCGDNEVENLELYDIVTGGIIDLTWNDGACTATTTEEIEILAGQTKKYFFRLDTTANADNGDIYNVTLTAANVTAEGIVSGSAITDKSPNAITSANMTVVISDLRHQTLAMNSINAIVGASNVKVYKGSLKASTSSNVEVSKIVFTSQAADTGFIDDNINSATLEINDGDIKTLSGQIVETAGADTLTFDGFTYVIPAGKEVIFYLKISVNSNATNNHFFTLDVSSITAKDADRKAITVVPDTTNGPLVTIKGTGYFDVYISNTEPGVNRNLFVVAGKNSDLFSTLKFDAQNEAVKIKKLELIGTEDDNDLAKDLAKVEILDSDKSTVLASSTSFTYGNWDGDGDNNELKVTFDNWNYTVAEPGVKLVYLRVWTKEIGTGAEQTGSTNSANAVIEFKIGSVSAEGVESGNTIVMTGTAAPTSTDTNSNWDNDDVTNNVMNVAVMPTAITNMLPNGVLTNTQTVIGKFKFAIASGNNTQSDGTAAKFDLRKLTLTLNTTGVTVTDGGAGNDAYIYWEDDESNKLTVNLDAVVDLSALTDFSSGERTLVIEAINITGAGDPGDSVQVKIDNLDGGNLIWRDTTGNEDITQCRLAKTSVVGGILSN